MKFYYIKPRVAIFPKQIQERKDTKSSLQPLDKAILGELSKTGTGGLDSMAVLNRCRPYKNQWGEKEFADFHDVVQSLKRLIDKGLVRRF